LIHTAERRDVGAIHSPAETTVCGKLAKDFHFATVEDREVIAGCLELGSRLRKQSKPFEWREF